MRCHTGPESNRGIIALRAYHQLRQTHQGRKTLGSNVLYQCNRKTSGIISLTRRPTLFRCTNGARRQDRTPSSLAHGPIGMPMNPNLRETRLGQWEGSTGQPSRFPTEIYDYTHARRRMGRRTLPWGVYDQTRRTLAKVAERVGRVPPYGAWLWRLRDE
jgi:hypothetical protein